MGYSTLKTMELRENQVQPVKIGVDFFNKKNAVPSIMIAPTAFGKSIVIAHIADAINDKILIIQPSKELLEQNFNKFTSLGGNASIYSASFNIKEIGNVTYATIGSIKNIGKTFKNLGFTKMIIDEAHLYPRNSDSMLGGFLFDSGITHVLGLTATPLKLQNNTDISGDSFSKLVMLTSRSKMGNFFKDIIYVSQISEMVELGFWSKLEYDICDSDNSKLRYNSTKSEFTDESINSVYIENNTSHKIIKKIKELSDRKSILVFVPSVEHAIALSEMCENSVAVYGDMSPKERKRAIDGFKTLKIRTVFNVNVLSVGFDHPQLDTIMLARETSSLSWLYQAIGRGTRIHADKKECLIVDFTKNIDRFGKIENLYYKKENVWKLYGEGGKLLTGCPLHEIGKHIENEKTVFTFGKYKGVSVEEVVKKDKGYIDWMMRDFQWNDYTNHIKQEIIKLSI
jgi:DNA repair protein RadD